MSNKLFLNSIINFPELLDELNKLLVQGAEATIENGKVVIEYDEDQAKRAKSRNAGRKEFGPAKAENYKAFFKLYDEGQSMQEISQETGMSLATCYRYKQLAEEMSVPPEEIGNRKYLLYRSEGNLDKNIRQHELVAVEYGKNIDAVIENLVAAVIEDLAGLEKYSEYEVDAYNPEPTNPLRKVKRYQYKMDGIVYSIDEEYNEIIEYGIIEK